ncbi:MAG TPA: hypothetical protein PKD64_07965 [Pirellulaceae bacterium]|nr:hypothetical protein [Pirellulaceae bacterium]HMO92123.1 hypothetical protein [Pirellulaceae bacterium]HMP69289.1 hypothetical protein [Pirellulaceae bacterium]
MSDLRFDPINGQWVAMASDRVQRPNEFQQIMQRKELSRCPFCAGNEEDTPPPILQVPQDPRDKKWIVRVFPNKYPSFSDDNGDKPANPSATFGPYPSHGAAGHQEVIVNSPRHVESMSELTREELFVSFQVYRERVHVLQENQVLEHVMLFKNCRAEAGASLQHIHTQIIGTPNISDDLRLRWERMRNHRDATGVSLLTSILEWEKKSEERMLDVTPNYTTFCPFASRFGYQVWIVPNQEIADFGRINDQQSDELAELCQKYVERFDQCLDMPAYNLLLHLAPREFRGYQHWFVELFPRLTRAAGFEWGTGYWINPFPPEKAAADLRKI